MLMRVVVPIITALIMIMVGAFEIFLMLPGMNVYGDSTWTTILIANSVLVIIIVVIASVVSGLLARHTEAVGDITLARRPAHHRGGDGGRHRRHVSERVHPHHDHRRGASQPRAADASVAEYGDAAGEMRRLTGGSAEVRSLAGVLAYNREKYGGEFLLGWTMRDRGARQFAEFLEQCRRNSR